MDSIEYAQRLGAKIQASFERGEEMPWPERVRKYGDEVMAEAEDEEAEPS